MYIQCIKIETKYYKHQYHIATELLLHTHVRTSKPVVVISICKWITGDIVGMGIIEKLFINTKVINKAGLIGYNLIC